MRPDPVRPVFPDSVPSAFGAHDPRPNIHRVSYASDSTPLSPKQHTSKRKSSVGVARMMISKSRHKDAKVVAMLSRGGCDSRSPILPVGDCVRAWSRHGALLLVAGSFATTVPACRADELLVMPFTCSVVGGQPMLTPSRETGHRILGTREQRTFGACSPVNPSLCRQWTLHRFDVDCGGVRVSWVSVAAAAERNGRAWLEDGRVRIRMGPLWNAGPGDPCARMPTYDDRWQAGRLARYCAERKALMPPAIVEMPVGFSPMLGTNAIIVSSTGHRADLAASNLPASETASPPLARTEVPPRQRSEQAVREKAPKAAASRTESARHPETPPQPAPVAGAAVPAPIPPRILNRDPAPEAPSPKLAPSAAPPSAQASSTPAPAAPAPADDPVTQVSPPPATADDGHDVIAVSLLSAMGGSSTVLLISIAAFMTCAIGSFAWVRWREEAHVTQSTSREFASVSLGSGKAHSRSLVLRAPVQTSPETSSLQAPAKVLSRLGDEMPRSREEALQVLGMGVTRDATETAIKKIVDGLRLSWHPDYATNPEDHRMRELRVKQVNAAWDIIRRRRVET